VIDDEEEEDEVVVVVVVRLEAVDREDEVD
jgi:hypothetical protein